MGPTNLKLFGYTFMAMNMQDKLTNKGHLFFIAWYPQTYLAVLF